MIQMLRCLLQILTVSLVVSPLTGCGDDATPGKDAADAGPADATYIEGPKTVKTNDLNLNLERWIPLQDGAADSAGSETGAQE